MSDTTNPASSPETNPAARPEPQAAQPAKAAAAKVKPPAPEDRPFADFIPELFLPALRERLEASGAALGELSFEQGPIPVVARPAWQVKGDLSGGRRFWLSFVDGDINGAKTFALAEGGSEPTLLESFLVDEKKSTLALLVSRVVSRLNGQKWLGPN
ncbi:DUF2996 domain-containing protein [Cyanobium sp. Morenito 9A2]|uniref:DUF2996 domain-containing protein n=1 Tax=Cyanobium sp. Morenito 9A2 TaxID=2823718 RepID=UPI0020CC5963|nr:DUF2996 domain-containing protein [Cyanobium sp. Morenito 9A2]MCP9848686.1 DUF2996 domain-containing protein [Cyanobium sp. Morenito 9A2]